LVHSAASATIPPNLVAAAVASATPDGAVSVTVAALVHGANRAMIASKIRTALVLFLAAGVVSVGLGVGTRPPAQAALPPTADPPAAARGLPADWSQIVAPDPQKDEAGQVMAGAKFKLWVEQGWLVVRRETTAGDLEWQVVLARADDPKPPQVRVDK